MDTVESLFRRLEQLNGIGAALSRERNLDRLLEDILVAAQTITRADGGTLYLVEEGAQLRFAIMRNGTLGIALGGTSGSAIPYYPIQLYKDGKPNNTMVAAYAAINKCTVNIADAYSEAGFDFSGTRQFDQRTGYRSQSFLTVPMKNHEGEIIGVLQLINCTTPDTREVVAFSESDRRLAESLASQAAVALTNRALIEQLEKLFESFIELINAAIDEKSPYTGGHCQRVPVLTMMLAEAASDAKHGPLASFTMGDKDRHELRIAGMLHDCGKITTPVHVVDKATKLETIFDRIGLVNTRFEVLKRDAEIDALRERLELREDARLDAAGAERERLIGERLRERLRGLEEDREFLRRCNTGGEWMPPEAQARVPAIAASHRWTDPSGRSVSLLSEEEIENLPVARGTLTAREREIINHHIVATIKMLEALPWPKGLGNVPE